MIWEGPVMLRMLKALNLDYLIHFGSVYIAPETLQVNELDTKRKRQKRIEILVYDCLTKGGLECVLEIV